ncbi:MAG: hypothetical protein L6Q98_17775 [Anaerolineae bacterium]|nr:hypothetical protein [Anaerolineae bacterium]NUQ05943.1 hypothetical protein [Anaerolineae bacterium]
MGYIPPQPPSERPVPYDSAMRVPRDTETDLRSDLSLHIVIMVCMGSLIYVVSDLGTAAAFLLSYALPRAALSIRSGAEEERLRVETLRSSVRTGWR